MSETYEQLLEHSIEIDAEPAQVWALVTDVPRMAKWSPQVKRSKVIGGQVKQGARFVNLNSQGLRHWPTSGKVVRFTPHQDFAFRIAENKTVWSFTLKPSNGGTMLTQRRETPDGISAVSMLGVKYVLGGQQDFTDGLNKGMVQTLARIKREAERA